ncbi:MAG TPA: SCP2 sterol-binding domain-containing protein [Gammaproteobacteria bacterium]|nr:SCP2 sterol-binding domain-containing protein [Gammaproteobacteria bacterium]
MPYPQDATAPKTPLDAIAVQAARLLPRAAIRMAGRVPEPAIRRVIQPFLNLALQRPLAAGEFDFLRGRTVMIHAPDLDQSITVTILEGRRLRLLGTKDAETTISATAKDFAGLAVGDIDPDTLFFQRRLRIEGNVALGLETKNTLDGVDPGTLPAPLQALLRLARVWLSRYEIPSAGHSLPRPRLSSPARPYQ